MKSLVRALLFAAALIACAGSSRAQTPLSSSPPSATSPATTTPAAADEPDEFALPKISDPFESVNRATLGFNDLAYSYVLRPVAHGYEWVTPAPVRRGLDNFFANLNFPDRLVSNLLQGKPGRAAKETGKFVVNSTFGLLGLFRVSDNFPALVGVPPADLGETFGIWGIGNGPFLILPVLGPSTVRDAVGQLGDWELNPVGWYVFDKIHGYSWEWTGSGQLVFFIDTLPGLVKNYDSLHQAAVDPYVALRSAYFQYRAGAAKQ
jgi:phospholipid-binding lipoprotein MlaA